MPILLTFVTLVVNVATAVLVPLLYLGKQTAITLPNLTIPLVGYGIWGLLAYATLNPISAKSRPGGNAYFYIDFVGSLLAFLSIVITAVLVFGFDYNKAFLATVSDWFPLLVALVVFAVIDMFWNQRANGSEVLARLANRPGIVPVTAGPFEQYDTPDKIAAAGVAAGLIPETVRMRLIIEPYMQTRDGLVPWLPRQVGPPVIDEPPGGGREEPHPKTH